MTNYERIMNAMNELSDNEQGEVFRAYMSCGNCPLQKECELYVESICDNTQEAIGEFKWIRYINLKRMARIIAKAAKNIQEMEETGEQLYNRIVPFLKAKENLAVLKQMKEFFKI